MKLDQLHFLVFGYGVSGKEACDYLKDKVSRLTVVNRDPVEVDNAVFLGQEKLTQEYLDGVDRILISPGIARETILNHFNFRAEHIISDVELFSLNFKKPIIAITGTNGKTTTVSLIDHILKSLGKNVFTGGNIGVPVLQGLKKDYDLALLELSSFQLESCFEFKPSVSVILNVTPNHGERYESFEDYKQAKLRIFNNCHNGLKLFDGSHRSLAIPTGNDLDEETSEFQDSYLLQGEHNLQNLWVALKVLEFLKVDKEEIKKVLKKFRGVEFRQELLDNSSPFKLINDAKSTNWEASLSALRSYKGHQVFLILGGKSRGRGDHPPSEFVEYVKREKVEVFLMGESGKDLKNCFSQTTYFETLKEHLNYLSKNKKEGVILFSPAFPSFDQYKNYVERGKDFNLLVKKIF